MRGPLVPCPGGPPLKKLQAFSAESQRIDSPGGFASKKSAELCRFLFSSRFFFFTAIRIFESNSCKNFYEPSDSGKFLTIFSCSKKKFFACVEAVDKFVRESF
jgi:hypothetical protein